MATYLLLKVVSVLTPILMLVFTQINIFWGIPVLIVLGIVLFAPSPVILSVVNNSKTKHLTFINGLYFTINFGLNAIMVMIMGKIADWIGLDTAYLISVAIGLIAIPFIWSLKEEY